MSDSRPQVTTLMPSGGGGSGGGSPAPGTATPTTPTPGGSPARSPKDIDEDEELMSQPAVKELREVVYRESYNFLRQQRLSCLFTGAWFQIPPGMHGNSSSSPTSSGGGGRDGGGSSPKRSNKPLQYRFCYLSGTKRTLHYGDFPEKLDRKPNLDQLTERIELSAVTDVLTGLSSPIHAATSPGPTPVPGGASHVSSLSAQPLAPAFTVNLTSSTSSTNIVPPPPPLPPGGVPPVPSATVQAPLVRTRLPSGGSGSEVSTLCFSLMGGPDNGLLHLICTSATQFSEWTDGLNLLLSRGIVNKDTTEFIQSLTDITVRLRLLDVKANGLELRDQIDVPPLPPNVNFFYEDVAGIGGAAPV
ncbi:hypothetical protein H9P43_004265 [Blastocladiella emersonii ATCC 22665]|nr:hypothetical protein H9P43_004265 [Blastocladiella emersonii ATCC 22665]